MNSKFLVSIQIPTYNQDKYIRRAIESALAQDYPLLEVIVLDDCSTDNTATIACEFTGDSRFRYVKNEKNLGRVGNYKEGLYRYCKGDFVVNLDGDDYFTDPQFVSVAINRIQENGGDGVAFYQATISSLQEQTGTSFAFRHKIVKDEYLVLDGKEYFMRCYENVFFSHLSTVYNATLAKAIGFYEYNILNTDQESMLKLSLHGKVILENRNVGTWMIHTSNASQQEMPDKENDQATVKRLSVYAAGILGKEQTQRWERDTFRSLELLYREQYAAHGKFGALLWSLFTYGPIRPRIFTLLAKALIKR